MVSRSAVEPSCDTPIMLNRVLSVRLGNSGLKVSKLILGTAMWGNPKFLPWSTIDEEAATEQVRVA